MAGVGAPAPPPDVPLPWSTVAATALVGLATGSGLLAYGSLSMARLAGGVVTGATIGLAAVVADRRAAAAPRALRWGVALALSALVPGLATASQLFVVPGATLARAFIAGAVLRGFIRGTAGMALGVAADSRKANMWQLGAAGGAAGLVVYPLGAAMNLAQALSRGGLAFRRYGLAGGGSSLLVYGWMTVLAMALMGLAIGFSLDRARRRQR